MKSMLLVGAGGFIGSISRYWIQQFINGKFSSAFPYGTLVVNLTGCFLIGLIFAFAIKGAINNDWRLFLATGLCGGFTTFSAFSMESISLFRTGEVGMGLGYIAASVVLGLLATFAGISVIKWI